MYAEQDDEAQERLKIKHVLIAHGGNMRLASQYETFSDFFSRHEEKRVEHADDDKKACAPADCRMVAYPNVKKAQVAWVKGTEFNLDNLLGDFSGKYAKQFEKGSVCICRLSPIDAHRWYLPVSGRLEEKIEIEGGYLPDLPNAVNNKNCNVYTTNKRIVSVISTKAFGTVILVAIGSAFVGSVTLLQKDRTSHKKGTEHGKFNYGGSTIILLFESNAIQFHQELLLNTNASIESYVEHGQTIGVAVEK